MNQLDLFTEKENPATNEGKEKKSSHTLDTFRMNYTEITWTQLLLKVWALLRVPFISAKHQLIQNAKNYVRTKPFPWFRLALVLLFFYAYFKKDMQFNINMGRGNTSISSEKNEAVDGAKLNMGNFARTANYQPVSKEGSVNLGDEQVQNYVRRFNKVALSEMEKFGIPASIKMGQAILASNAGKNQLAEQFNNHFAITCEGGANCKSFATAQQMAMVQHFATAWESWRAHSMLLSSPRYNHLQSYGKDYKKWANGLEAAGYGAKNQYANQLIQVIDRYQLQQLDAMK
ncbi:MAG: glucosaminidase domain-containing protein [Bacteroidota bacterium]